MKLGQRELLIWALAFLAILMLASILGNPKVAVFLFILLGLIMLARYSIRAVNEYERLVILRMGRSIGAKGPGMVLVIPFVDNPISLDTREQYREMPQESCITKDNAKIDVDYHFSWKIKNPELAVTRVQNIQDILGGLATGMLRSVIGEFSLDEVLVKREHINHVLREKINENTKLWGVEFTTVEIREIVTPVETRDSMTRQMSAEWNKRAMILEAEGYKKAQILKAQGDAAALELLHDAARKIDQNTLNLKYLETLRQLGESESTKYIFPMELESLVRLLAKALQDWQAGEPSSSTDSVPGSETHPP
jgi:regulator of protease activity HflC (stomatin/prohibitin superfamily)